MNSLFVRRLASGLMAAVMAASMAGFTASAEALPTRSIGAEKEDGYLYLHGQKYAKIQSDGSYTMYDLDNPHYNGVALNNLITGNKKKKIRLPKGTWKTDRTIVPGSNTTIIATGTHVFQTDNQKNVIMHEPVSTDYKSLTNVKIKGGTWEIKDNKKQLRATSTFRFNFASGITLDGCTVLTNYKSHAVELIACKNIKVKGCKLIAKGKTISDSLEEALQIDISTKATAPSVAPYGAKFVKGQTCSDITVQNCTISGSRGLCANKTDTQGEKYLGKYHRNIKVIGCTITGMTSEAVALHNAVGLTVKNNTIISKGKRTDTVYTIGLNIETFKKNAISSKYRNTITGNTIKGGLHGLYIGAVAGNKFGPTTVKNNKIYCKKGKKNALSVNDCSKKSVKGNKLYKW